MKVETCWLAASYTTYSTCTCVNASLDRQKVWEVSTCSYCVHFCLQIYTVYLYLRDCLMVHSLRLYLQRFNHKSEVMWIG